MQQTPYPGPRAFLTGETLYGRERETLELLDLLIAERIVLLYAPSGAGKTSLIQAALVPRLRQEGYNVLPSIRVKFDHTLAPEMAQTNRYLASALFALQQGPAPTGHNGRADSLHLPFGAYLDRLLSEDPTSQVLIFDQFEEVLTIDPTNLAAKEEFFINIGETLRNRDRWALFAMREDRIAGLDPYLRHIPTRLSTTYRLDLLRNEAASEAIREPAHAAGIDFTAAAAEKLVNDLRWTQVQCADGTVEPQLGPYVEPVQLQVVCLRLWDQLPDGAQQVEESDIVGVGSVDEALAAYYAASVSSAANATGEQERLIRDWIGRQLITEQGVRSQVLMEQGRSRGLANDTIRLLEDAHLVRADERRGITWFELSHDRLIEPIRTNNADWFRQNLSMLQLQADLWNTHDRQAGLLLQGESLTEAQAWAESHTSELTNDENEFLEACLAARADAERNERIHRRILWLAVCTSVLAVAALIATLYSLRQSYIVETQREAASARQLAAQSMATVDSDVDTGLLLAVEAYKSQRQPLDDVRSSLLSAYQCCSDSLLAFLHSHTDRIWDVSFSLDGRLLASSGDDGSVVVWDIAARTEITTINNPTSTAAVYTVAFSPRGDILATGDGDGEIVLRSTNTWQPIDTPLRGHDFNVHSLVFSNDGSLLVSGGGDGKVVVWSVATRKPIRTFVGPTSWIWDVAISPDNLTVASVGRDKTVRLWSLDPTAAITTSVVMTAPHNSIVTSVAFNTDPILPLMITGDADGYVVVWDMRHWNQDHEPPLGIKPKRIGLAGSIIWGLAFIPGKALSFVSSSSLGIITRQHIMLATDMRQVSLKPEKLGAAGNSMGTFRLAVSPDGSMIAAAGLDKLVSLWSSDEAPNVLWHSEPVDSMRVLNAQPDLVSLDRSGTLFRWGYRPPKLLSRLSLAPLLPFSNSVISYDGSVIATGDFSGTVTIWNGQNGHEERQLVSGLGPIESLAFSKDGTLLAAGDVHGRVVLWDHGELVRLPAYVENDSAMKVLRFSLDGKILLGGGCGHPIRFPVADCGRGEIYVWDVLSRRLSGVPLPAHSGFVLSLSFNPANPDEFANGTRDGNITIWSLHDRKPRISFGLNGPSGIGGTPDINDLAFSPDGQLLAVALDSYRVYLVNAQTGHIFGRYFKEHDTYVNEVAFSPDGTLLLSASGDDTIAVHDMEPEHWLEKACRIANRNLTAAEWARYVDPDPASYHQTCPGFK